MNAEGWDFGEGLDRPLMHGVYDRTVALQITREQRKRLFRANTLHTRRPALMALNENNAADLATLRRPNIRKGGRVHLNRHLPIGPRARHPAFQFGEVSRDIGAEANLMWAAKRDTVCAAGQ